MNEDLKKCEGITVRKCSKEDNYFSGLQERNIPSVCLKQQRGQSNWKRMYNN